MSLTARAANAKKESYHTNTKRDTEMIGYIERAARRTFNLRICARPCNGAEYTASPVLPFSSKAEAKAYCEANKIQPWNF